MESSKTYRDQKSVARIMVMQEYHDLFIASLMLLLNILNGHLENANKLQNALEAGKIDTDKKGLIIRKVYSVLDANFDLLENSDLQLFNLYGKQSSKDVKVTIIPAIDIGSIWQKLSLDDQKKIWKYLKCMYISTVHMMNTVGDDDNNNNNNNSNARIDKLRNTLSGENNVSIEFWEQFPQSNLVTKESFNPYIGVGENKREYGLNELLSGPKLLPDQTAPGVEGMAGLLGLDKMVNMEDLSNQLKNISKEQIDQAAQSIKSMLGDVDEGTSGMIDSMLNDITDELANENMSDGNPINNLVKIAESVAQKMMPKIDSKKVDMRKVWSSTRDIASKCQDKNGNSLFDGPNNPLSIVTSLMEKKMGGSFPKKQDKQDPQDKDDKEHKQKKEEECAKECQQILKQMGLPDLSTDQLKNLQIDKLMEQINGSGLQNEKKKKKKNKNNK